MCDPLKKDYKHGTNAITKSRQYFDHKDDKVIKDTYAKKGGVIFNDDHSDHGCLSHGDKSSHTLFGSSHCHVKVSENSFMSSTAPCSAFSYSSSSSSSFSSLFSSSSSASSSSLDSNTSSECRDRSAFKKPSYSQSCTDISEKRRYFEGDCDTAPLIDIKSSWGCSGKNKLGGGSAHSHVQEYLHRTHNICSGSKTDGNIRKSRSMEALVRTKNKGGHENEDENEAGMRESEARKKVMKEKLKFSAFLNEITRQVLSPVRLTTLGVKDFHPSCKKHQTCGQSKKNEKKQRSQSIDADSPTSRKQTRVTLRNPKSFHQNLMHNPAQSATCISPRTGSSIEKRCLKKTQTHRHHRCSHSNQHCNHLDKGDPSSTHQCHHNHHQTHATAYYPEDHNKTHSRGHNRLHHHRDQLHANLHQKDHPHKEHHLRYHCHGVHNHGDPHHTDHDEGDYYYEDHSLRQHYRRDSKSPSSLCGHRHHCYPKNHHNDAQHFQCGSEHGHTLHHGVNNITSNHFHHGDDSDCTTRRHTSQTLKYLDGYIPRASEDPTVGLLGDYDSVQTSSYNEVTSSGQTRDHHFEHRNSGDQEDYQRSDTIKSYSHPHPHHHHNQRENHGCPDHQMNHNHDSSRPDHQHYHRNKSINRLPHHRDLHHQSEAYFHHHDNHHYSKSHPYHLDNQPQCETNQHYHASPCVEHHQKAHTLEFQDNTTLDCYRPFSRSSPLPEKLESTPAKNIRSLSSHDEEPLSVLDASSIHKEETHEMGRIMVLQDKNEYLLQSLQKTAMGADCLGEDFVNSHKLLMTELQNTKTELNNLTKKFLSLQDSYSSTQHSNDLLQEKISLVTQNMEDERERLNIRISALTKKIADVKIIDRDTEIITKTSSLHKTRIRFDSGEAANQLVTPPPAEFTDSHDYKNPKVLGQEQSLGSVPEEEESDWSEMGEETPLLILTRTASTNVSWRNQEVDISNVSGSTSEELVRGHSDQKPHFHFTCHGEVLPSLPTSTCQSELKNLTERNYKITSSPSVSSSLLIRSASLGEIPVVHHQMQQELKSTEVMMDLYQPGPELIEDLDGDMIHNWKTINFTKAATESSMQANDSLVGLQSADEILNSLIPERVEVLGGREGISDEVLRLEWTKL